MHSGQVYSSQALRRPQNIHKLSQRAGACRYCRRRAAVLRAAKTDNGPSVAIVGVTGAVGQEFLRVRPAASIIIADAIHFFKRSCRPCAPRCSRSGTFPIQASSAWPPQGRGCGLVPWCARVYIQPCLPSAGRPAVSLSMMEAHM